MPTMTTVSQHLWLPAMSIASTSESPVSPTSPRFPASPVSFTTPISPLEPTRSNSHAVEELRCLLQCGTLPGEFVPPANIPTLKNHLEPCRLIVSPVLLHEVHDALVNSTGPLVKALTAANLEDIPQNLDFDEALALKVLDYVDELNTVLPAAAQLDAHIGDGVTLYLRGAGGKKHTLIGLGVPHGYPDEDVTSLLQGIAKGEIYVQGGSVSACAMQPVLNNILLLMTHHHVNFAMLSNSSSTILLRRSEAHHPPMTPLVEVSRVVVAEDAPAPLLSHSALGLVLGAVVLALKERGVGFGDGSSDWEMLKRMWPENRY